MGAYNRVNGEAACASKTLQKILREDWGFKGHFVSDCWAIRDFHENHMITSTPVESAALAINTGCDLNCGNTYLYIMKAYEEGLVSEDVITEAAVRLYTTRFLLGLFDGSEYDSIPYTVVESPEHLALSEKAAAESFVLVKNNGILPLNKDEIRTIAVIGPNANSRAALAGNYHGTASRYVTIQEGIQDYTDGSARVLTAVGCDLFRDRTEPLAEVQDRMAEAVAAAENSDVVILCPGLDETLEGEEGDTGNSYASGDKESLMLPEVQRQLMEAIAKTEKPVILCLTAGSDIDLSFAAEHFDAVMVLWYPGANGGSALAKVLFGDEEPGGKLPVTFYNSLSELPDFSDYSMKGRTYRFMENEAQYPFGYGLTYGDIRVEQAEFICESDEEAGISPRVNAVVKNDSGRTASDVIQVYVKNMDSPLAVPNPQLFGFKRITLETGEQAEVSILLPEDGFKVVNEEGERIFDGDRFEIFVGTSQPDRRSIALTGKVPVRVEVSLGR